MTSTSNQMDPAPHEGGDETTPQWRIGSKVYSSIDEVIAEIAVSRTLITGDEWLWFGLDGRYKIACKPMIDIGEINFQYDARFVANSPAYVEALLSIVRMQTARLDAAEHELALWKDGYTEQRRMFAEWLADKGYEQPSAWAHDTGAEA